MIPKRLYMKNFLSHAQSELLFDNFDIALVLGMTDSDPDRSNGSGKTSMLEAICWVLFDKHRHKKKDGVVKDKKDIAEVEYEFYLGDVLYKVKRIRNKIVNDSDVFLYISDGGCSFRDISCDTPTLTNQKIVDIVGMNHEVLINSVYFKQGDIDRLAKTTPSSRKAIIKDMLRLDKWDKYQKVAKNKAKSLSDRIGEKKKSVKNISDIDGNIEECKKRIVQLKKDREEKKLEYGELNSKLMEKRVEFEKINNEETAEKLKKVKEDRDSEANKIQRLKGLLKDNNAKIESSQVQIGKNKDYLEDIKTKKSLVKKVDTAELKSKIEKGIQKESELNLSLKQHQKTLDSIKSVEGGICRLCNRPLDHDEAEHIKKETQDKIAEIEPRHIEVKERLKRAKRKLDNMENESREFDGLGFEIKEFTLKISDLKNTIEQSLESNKRTDEELSELNKRDYDKEIAELKSNLCSKEVYYGMKQNLDKLAADVKEVGKCNDKINFDFGSENGRCGELENVKKEQEILHKELEELNKEYLIYDKLRDHFGKDGIQSVIVGNVIEDIENYSNDVLSKICNQPTTISIRTQKQNDNGTWAETFDILVKEGDRESDFDTFSGGEKFRISLAMRLALSKILSSRLGGEIRFLMLDEVSTSLDKHGANVFLETIRELSKTMKVLVITHDEMLKDSFENVIIVNKGSEGSVIVSQ